MTAAYACDRIGLEHDAVVHYERAWALGVPAAERPGFLVGFGSTLRNVGRVADAVARLDEAVRAYPEDPALHAFRALALHSAGRHAEALATMLAAGLLAARAGGFAGYERALAEYQAELLAAARADDGALTAPAVGIASLRGDPRTTAPRAPIRRPSRPRPRRRGSGRGCR